MTIRAARLPDDEPAILSFIWACRNSRTISSPIAASIRDFAAEHWADVRLAPPRGAIFIAEANGAAVGWAFLLEEPGDIVRGEA